MAPQNINVGDLIVRVDQPPAGSHKPAVLLIHGMFGGAWYWENYQTQLASRGYALDTLSMGMSEDLEIAIAEGSTMVRVGTALFGPRPD